MGQIHGSLSRDYEDFADVDESCIFIGYLIMVVVHEIDHYVRENCYL
jgi:hypothetical protein